MILRGAKQFLLFLAVLIPGLSGKAQILVGGSPFYEFKVVTHSGETVTAGGAQAQIIQVGAGMAINDLGQAVVPVRISQNGSNAPGIAVEVPGGFQPYIALNPGSFISGEEVIGPVIKSVDYADSGQFAYDLWETGAGLLPAATIWRGRVSGGIATLTKVERRTGLGQSEFATHASWPQISADGTIACFTASFDPFALGSQPQTNNVTLSKPGLPGYSVRVHQLFSGVVPDGVQQANYPVIGQNEVFAVVEGQRTNDARVIRVDESRTEQLIAATGDGWEHFGWFCDMTEDSKFVTFFGRKDTGQEGLFLRIFDAEWGDPKVIALMDTNFIFAVNEGGDPIRFKSFDFRDRPCIIHQNTANPAGVFSNSIVVVFHATPNQASRANPYADNKPMFFSSQPGLWAARFTIEKGLGDTNYSTVHFRALTPIIQLGDLIMMPDGGALPIDDLQVFNGLGSATREADGANRRTIGGQPMPGDHVVGFWANAGDQSFAIKGYHLDTDGDGLLDHWERGGEKGGIDIDRDGSVDLPLADMGADELRQDLFLEVDWTAPRPHTSIPGGWNNAPSRYALLELVYLFQIAPVQNPNGTTGIELHIDAGSSTDEDGSLSQNGMLSAPKRQQGGDLVTTELGERPDVIFMNPADQTVPLIGLGPLHMGTFDSIKEKFFGTTDKKARELAFRYAIIADFPFVYEVDTPAGKTNVLTVASATPGQLRSTPISFGAGSTISSVNRLFNNAGAVMLLSGTAAGQVRRVLSVAAVPAGAPGYFSLQVNLTTNDPPFLRPATPDRPFTPSATTPFVLFSGNSGQAEFFAMSNETGFTNSDYHRLPSNDLLISFGGSRSGADLNRDSTDIWRTFAHEMGHTLGLAHGGRNVLCSHDGNNHLSLMSYSHQFRTVATNSVAVGGDDCTSPIQSNLPPSSALAALGGVVESFSDGTDPHGFNEWGYLRMETWATPWMLGNSLQKRGASFGDAEDLFDLPSRYGEQDHEGPVVQLDSPTNRVLALGATLVPAIIATDASGVAQVRFSFDADGDGIIAPISETVLASTADFVHFTATFPGAAGTNGVRALTIEATDTLGNQTAVREMFLVGAGFPPDNSSPYIDFAVLPPVTRFAGRPLNVSVSVYDDSYPPDGGVHSVVVYFDRNGDGTNSATEVFRAGLGTDNRYHASTGSLELGTESNRVMTVVATDRWGHRATNSLAVIVLPPDLIPPVVSPIQPTPGITVSYGDVLPVLAQVTDNDHVAEVDISADLDGNGTFDYGESLIAQSGGANTFKAVFGSTGYPTFTGPPGSRSLQYLAFDYYGNVTETNFTFNVADTLPPQVVLLNPPAGIAVSPAVPMTVQVLATDDRGIDHVWVRYDADGNGSLDFNETPEANPLGGSVYEASFLDYSGPAGGRVLVAIAVDLSGRTSVVSQVVYRTDTGTFPPGQTAATSRSFLPSFECPIGLDASEAVFWFDVDGDGTTNGPMEQFVVTAPGTNRTLRAIFSNLSGPPGPRPLTMSLSKSGGGSVTVQTNVTVLSGGENPGLVSTKLASVPLLPEPGIASYYYTPAQIRSGGMSSAARLGSNIIFSAHDSRETYESLWVTDGSPTGTRLLARVSTDNAIDGFTDDPAVDDYFTEYNERLFFHGAQDSGDGLAPTNATSGLWVTDGTVAGTRSFGNPPGINSGARPVVFQDRLYYLADSAVPPLGPVLVSSDGTNSSAVTVPGLRPDRIVATDSNLFLLQWNRDPATDGWWVSDGTVGGTRQITTNLQVQVKSTGFGFYRVGREFVTISNLLYFPAKTSTNGIELWRTDGTPAGTMQLADIEPGPGNSLPNYLTALNGDLYFSASNSLTGTELWRSDGTPAGTMMVADIVPGFGNSFPSYLTAYSSRLYFQANDTLSGAELWVSDGTEAGTHIFTNLAPHSASGFGTYPSRHAAPGPLQVAAGRLFFEADNGLGDLGRELWSTDGTVSNTTLARDIAQLLPDGDFPITPSLSSFARRLTDGGAYLAFRGNDNLYGTEIWRSDGTPGGTYLLKDNATADAGKITAGAGTVLFQMADPLRGRELGSSRTGYGILRDVNLGPNSSQAGNFTWVGSRCFFTANEPVGLLGYLGTALYVTDGTSNATAKLAEFDYGGVTPGVVLGNKLLFAGTLATTTGTEPWVSDGTIAGTVPLGNLNPGDASSAPAHFVVAGNRGFFVASNAVVGAEWWATDGTPAGTVMLPELMPGSASADPVPIGVLNGQLAFFGRTPAAGWEPMVLNPATLAVTLLADTVAGSASGFADDYAAPSVVGNNQAYLWNRSFADAGLWVTDGTPAGTRKVGGTDIGNIHDFTPQDGGAFAGSHFVFGAAGNFGGGLEPWVSDGTVAGTMLLTNIMPDIGGFGYPSSPADFISLGDLVIFTATEPAGGLEVWRTDGTQAGTYRLADARPGPRSSFPRQFTQVGNLIYFTAYTEATGRELWVTDGTVAGTGMIEDLNPGPQGSDPASLFPTDTALYYFAADHGDDLSLRAVSSGLAVPILITDVAINSSGASPALEFSYRRRLNAVALGDIFTIEVSKDLVTWDVSSHMELGVTPDTFTETARVLLPETPDQALFVRVRLNH